MKIFSFKHTKQKKYKQLALNLAAIESKHKDALLKEYFNLCKMIYRIASLVDYTWCQNDQEEDSHELILELFSENQTFDKMIAITHAQLENIFSGTDPEHKVIKEPKEAQIVITKKQMKRQSSLQQLLVKENGKKNAASTKSIQPMKVNFYDTVAHLFTEDTDIMYKILRALAQYEILKDPTFKSTVAALKAKMHEMRQKAEEDKEKEEQEAEEAKGTQTHVNSQYNTDNHLDTSVDSSGPPAAPSFLTSLPKTSNKKENPIKPKKKAKKPGLQKEKSEKNLTATAAAAQDPQSQQQQLLHELLSSMDKEAAKNTEDNNQVQSEAAQMLQSLFPNYSAIFTAERVRLIEQFVNGKQDKRAPVFRYIPTRYLMQRLILKATLLPYDFEKFEEHY